MSSISKEVTLNPKCFDHNQLSCIFDDSTIAHFKRHMRGANLNVQQILEDEEKDLPWYLGGDEDVIPPINFNNGPGLMELDQIEMKMTKNLKLDFYTLKDDDNTLKFKDNLQKAFYIPQGFLIDRMYYDCTCGKIVGRDSGFVLHYMVNYCVHLLSEHKKEKQLVVKASKNLKQLLKAVEVGRKVKRELVLDFLPGYTFSCLLFAKGGLKTYICSECQFVIFNVERFWSHCLGAHGVKDYTKITCVDTKRIHGNVATTVQKMATPLLIVRDQASDMYKWGCSHCDLLIEKKNKIPLIINAYIHLCVSDCAVTKFWLKNRKPVFKNIEAAKASVIEEASKNCGKVALSFLKRLNYFDVATLIRTLSYDKKFGVQDLKDVDWSCITVCPFCLTLPSKTKKHFKKCPSMPIEVELVMNK
ncbi:unnamed protein product [Bursaphelenchus okinawaensis]|uniref:Uncharacterized protein n=1 Tax=Bursaphelenchus okinawaensis TaxID=465554 RepID=A0A811K339_9BILA|nr:unnamed protein product [Bursaphelenchus okinawaensis]CAG9090915.1 unnamed protein product [Bursaphelenchus okinawaensis]